MLWMLAIVFLAERNQFGFNPRHRQLELVLRLDVVRRALRETERQKPRLARISGVPFVHDPRYRRSILFVLPPVVIFSLLLKRHIDIACLEQPRFATLRRLCELRVGQAEPANPEGIS